MDIELGLCSTLNKGIINNSDNWSLPINFTAFLTPPKSDEDEVEGNGNLWKLALQEKLNTQVVNILTQMNVSIPMKTDSLKHHIKNYAGSAGRLFGQHSMLYTRLKELWVHIDSRDSR